MWQVVTEFEEDWASGMVQGWGDEAQDNGHVPSQNTGIDLDYYSNVEELIEVGPEKLKEVQQFSSRFFSNFFHCSFHFKYIIFCSPF